MKMRVLGVTVAALCVVSFTACGSRSSTAQPKALMPHPATSRRSEQPTPTVGRTHRTKRRPLAGVTVGIDPGHNGDNYKYPQIIDRQIFNGREDENCNTTGTETDAGYTEAEYNFRVASDLRSDLLKQGARVVMTRSNNHGVGPCVNTRAQIIDRAHPAVAIDIHADGGPADGRGFAILLPVKDRENQHVIGSSAEFGDDLRAAVLEGTTMPVSTYDGVDGLTHRDDLAGLNLTTVPEVLIECGNMRNATDAALLTSNAFQHQIATAMLAAMETFLGMRH